MTTDDDVNRFDLEMKRESNDEDTFALEPVTSEEVRDVFSTLGDRVHA